MANFCSKCGASLSDGVKFCQKCGTPVVNAAAQPPKCVNEDIRTIVQDVTKLPEERQKQLTRTVYSCIAIGFVGAGVWIFLTVVIGELINIPLGIAVFLCGHLSCRYQEEQPEVKQLLPKAVRMLGIVITIGDAVLCLAMCFNIGETFNSVLTRLIYGVTSILIGIFLYRYPGIYKELKLAVNKLTLDAVIADYKISPLPDDGEYSYCSIYEFELYGERVHYQHNNWSHYKPTKGNTLVIHMNPSDVNDIWIESEDRLKNKIIKGFSVFLIVIGALIII